jgi:hypothetical protein
MTLVADEFLFIHVPRTGGSSISQALRTEFACTDIPRHQTFAEVVNTLGRSWWRFSFGFVRNPWDRMVSMHLGSGAHTDLAGWMRTGCPRNPRWGSLIQADFVDGVEFVGRFEQLNRDFAQICSVLGVSLALPHVGALAHTHYSDYYTDETRYMVETICKKDIDAFGYTF